VLRTPLCGLLGIEAPIVGAPFGPWEQVELAAAICEAGALGSVGTALRPAAELRAQWERLRELTARPFAINHTVRPFDEAAFAATLEFGPPAISFHLGVAPDLIARAHDAGIVWIQQVMDGRQAEQALEAGADVLVAQGGEAGGNGGWVGTIVLVPQVVDVAGHVPVLAAGGIADGSGLAAALVLGAEGVLLGTRFLATPESPLPTAYKEAICASDGHDTLLTELPDVISGQVWPGAFARVLRTPFIQTWLGREGEVRRRRTELREQVARARESGDVANGSLLIGQDAGLIERIEPAADLVKRLVREAEEILARRPAEVLSNSTRLSG
jgi:nitronate monooxygenase/enoyl-[acyl-carrier protein] reductase II